MNIGKLTTQQKSVLLAGLVDTWEVVERVDYARVCNKGKVGPCLFEMHKNHNFYTVDSDGNPHLMGWAWRILNWGLSMNSPLYPDDPPGASYVWARIRYVMNQSLDHEPAVAQTAWLDEIIELAIAAGLVESQS